MTGEHFHYQLAYCGRCSTQHDRDPFEYEGGLSDRKPGGKEALEYEGLEVGELGYELCGGFGGWGSGLRNIRD